MDTHEEVQKKSFYEQLKNCFELDLRDKRGKVHDLPFVLLGLTISLLLNRDGNLSSIQRCMKNKGASLCAFLGIDNQRVVSRSHLPVLLQKVKLEVFEALLFANYGLVLKKEEKSWFSVDGKELRGSIESGDKRGEALVQLVRHDDGAVLGQHRYNGDKESERPCLRELLVSSGATNQKLTMDALHLCPLTTDPIAHDGGVFLIGLKANQKELMSDMQAGCHRLKPSKQHTTVDKGHGRLEKRSYFLYDVRDEYFDKRWKKSQFSSLIRVERQRQQLKTGKVSTETAYYISNGKADATEDYFFAIRKHWSVEVNNHIRDVTLREDQLKTKKSP